MLHRVIYKSKPLPGLDLAALEELISPVRKRALVFNAAHHLSGVLAYSTSCFIQAIEGEPANIDLLLAKIASDPRHTDFEIIDRREIHSRTFPDWAMAFASTPDLSADGISKRDMIRFLIEAAQKCNGVRAIPGFVQDSAMKMAAQHLG